MRYCSAPLEILHNSISVLALSVYRLVFLEISISGFDPLSILSYHNLIVGICCKKL